MQHISLFSGIGGFDLASEWMGWTNVASCEINPFGRKVLDYYWPSTYHHDDIHTLTKELLIEKSNWNEQEPTILTGGFPCQPYSAAGKRLGKEDERHLWPEMLRVIRAVRPRWAVGENVRGIISWSDGLVFEEVQADLESEGYEVWAFLLPACGVDAPHKRDRVWFVAYHNDRNGEEIGFQTRRKKHLDGNDGALPTPNTKHDGHPATERGRSDGADSQRCEGGQNCTEQFKGVCQSGELGGLSEVAAYAEGANKQRYRQLKEQQEGPIGGQDSGAYISGDSANSNNSGLQETRPKQQAAGFEQHGELDGNATNADSERQQKCYHAGKSKGQRWFDRQFSSPENWQNFPTQPPVCSRNDGLSTELDGITFSKWRNESIKAAGNAIVPQVALQIFKTIEEFER